MSQDLEKIAHRRNVYWRRTRVLTFTLLFSGFVLTFAVVFFARELSNISLFGWPFPFYMAAQGLILLYVSILIVYAKRMQQLDKLFKSESMDVQ